MKMNQFEYFLMTFVQGRRTYLRGIIKRLRDMSNLGPGKKILEIGCGNGIGTQLIHEIFKPAEFIATEFDERLVEIARMKNKGLNIWVEAGDATALRFRDDEFDALIGLSVIHHIPNWRDCVDELYRVIKPGGLLIIKELSIDTFETPSGRVARRFVENPYESMLRKDEFLAYAQQRGFGVLACEPHSMLYLLTDFLLIVRKEC
jgi:ubiquinone/menaquinone biosynthesis C-methylase UbiE